MRTLRPHALVLLMLSATGCDQAARGSRVVDAAGPGHSYLATSYPAEFRAGPVVLTGELIARGDSLYHGLIGQANCILCHGPFLTGGTDGTNLRDERWHNGDGSYAFIVSTIYTGVRKPDHLNMPPRGGTPLTGEEVRALAAYVYWFAHTRTAPDDATPGHDSEDHPHGESG